MKVINLNKFSGKHRVIIDDVEYTVTGLTVKNYIEDDLNLAAIDTAETPREKVTLMVETITKISDIPKEVLLMQPFEVVNAVVQVAQGIDPTLEAEQAAQPDEALDTEKK